MARILFNWLKPYSANETYADALIRLFKYYAVLPSFSGNITAKITEELGGGMTYDATARQIIYLRKKGLLPTARELALGIGSPYREVQTPDKKQHPVDFAPKMLETIIGANRLINERDVRQEEVFPAVATDRWVGLVVGGDWHFEHYRTNTKGILEDLKRLGSEPDVYFGFNGDLGDFIDLRFMELENETVDVPLRDRVEVIEYLVSLVPNMLFMVMGCHDNWVRTRARQDMIEKIQKKIMGYYLGFGGIVNFKVGDNTYRIAAHHKYGCETSKNHFNPNYTYLMNMDAACDIVALSHRHDIVGIANVYWQGIPRVFMRSGSHQYKTEYAWKEGFRGAIARYPMVLLHGGKDKMMIPVVNYRYGLPILRALNEGRFQIC